MQWKQPTHPIERAAVAISALSFGAALAFATFALVPLSGLLLAAAAASSGAVAAGAAFVALGRIGARAAEPIGFSASEIEEAVGEQAVDDELLLNDPLPTLDPDSRVIRLFQREQPESLPEPGELVTRIADFLGAGRARAAGEGEPAPNDAHAALHLALADIRRSLR